MEFRVMQSTNTEEQDFVPVTIQSCDHLTIKLIDDRKKLSSEVWKYYGLLCNGDTLINPNRYYCSLCLKDLQDHVNSGLKGGLSCVHNVSITTATGNLKMHLLKGHNVNTFPDSMKERFDSPTTSKIEGRKIYVSVGDGILESANLQNDLTASNYGTSSTIGVNEAASEDAHNLISICNRLKASLERHISNFSAISILSEIWFNPIISTFYLKISAFFIDSKWDTNSYVLCYTPLESVSDQNILWCYEQVFRKFNLLQWKSSRIHIVCTKLIPHIPFVSDQELCVVFLVNKLITKDGLYSSLLFKNLLLKCVNIVSKINSSPFFDSNFMVDSYDFLHELAEVYFIMKFDEQNPLMVYNKSNKFPETDVAGKHMMRTCVILHLLKFIFENIIVIHKSLNLIGLSHLCLLDSELHCIKSVIKFLDLFYELSDIFKNCNNTLIVVPALKNKVREFCKVEQEEDSVIVDVKASIHSHLDDYFQMNYFVKMACILDPSVRDIIDKDDAYQMLLNRLKIIANEGEEKGATTTMYSFASSHSDLKNDLAQEQSEANGTISKKLKLFEPLRPHYQTGECEDNLMKEVKQYMQHVPTIEESEMPLLFWKNHSHKYPNLSLLAREHLSIPASCLPSSSIVSLASLKSQMDLIHANTFRLNTFSYFHNNLQIHF
ncbi:UNVERIFIED_CONTAM: hypothetical protein RMT77_005958 [Armadillidium vulgare]